ncbi:hypothetical protein [Candidatus Mycoplasma mahonii]|uniref:glycoside hydrolase family 38 N-terminal domain-containing protein n=1 Tax=Candidatus Mycoplasma mahonii TaxID=3004105 RepID=UPI0026F2874B|nr:hypothetical protein [Candidatus Mycoplasma mahonii]WKX02634.1 hypothetical protein O3I44_00965 [Candidatus Mycoplasma mahonii]
MKFKIHLVPHTHWDREWYFTFDSSNVLLNNALNDLKHHKNQKWLIDGQWSLLDDYIKWNPNKKNIIKKLLRKKSITSGPLYSQPDVFNSQAETIFRNFEIGKNVADSFGIKQVKTAYLPDTFGFGENIPQIFNLSGITNFVFWRGLCQDQLDKSDHFIWEGPNNSKLKSFVLREGYYALGMYYPYNKNKLNKMKKNPNIFLGKVQKLISTMKVDGENSLILPLGGDQAPFMIDQNNFVNELNKISDKYEFILESSYDDYFKDKKINSKICGDLREPITGKIHRTITSSRYDIKKTFRNIEDSLYYLLEPLEIYYKQFDRNYDFENFKNENIMKPMLIAQTHDSLGGCNTDITNNHQMNRIERVNENIFSQIDLLIKKIIQERNIKEENIIIFNPAPFKTSLVQKKIIYSAVNKAINISNKNFSIFTIKSENISLNPNKPLYKQETIIIANNLKPLSFNVFNVAMSDDSKIKLTTKSIVQNYFEISKNVHFKLKLIEDNGDSYDFSPGKDIPLKLENVFLKKTSIKKIDIYILYGFINKSFFEVFASKINGNFEFEINLDNKLKNTKLSLIFPKNTKIKKSLNLTLTDFEYKDIPNNWEDKYQEYPANVGANDGLISFNGINILTSGTNEVFNHKDKMELTLFRTYDKVTKGNMEWRKTTSGLSWSEDSIDSQLQKKLTFHLGLYKSEPINSLNMFKYKPYIYKEQSRNFTANKMTKFVINNIINKQKKIITVDFCKDVFISSMRQNGKNIIVRAANMKNKNIKAIFKINNHAHGYDFKPYEIKLFTLNIKENYE